jgi:hypothetical protein
MPARAFGALGLLAISACAAAGEGRGSGAYARIKVALDRVPAIDTHDHLWPFDRLEVRSAALSADGKTVTLEIPEIRPVMQMKISFRLRAADGAPVAFDVHNTIHALGD